MKSYANCAVSFLGSIIGLFVVHFASFYMALSNKSAHASRSDAFWQAVFYDFMVGIPVAALCGWGTAYYLRFRSQPAQPETVD